MHTAQHASVETGGVQGHGRWLAEAHRIPRAGFRECQDPTGLGAGQDLGAARPAAALKPWSLQQAPGLCLGSGQRAAPWQELGAGLQPRSAGAIKGRAQTCQWTQGWVKQGTDPGAGNVTPRINCRFIDTGSGERLGPQTLGATTLHTQGEGLKGVSLA